MESGWTFKSCTSTVVRRGAHYQQRVRAGGTVKCTEMGKVSGIGAWGLDDHRGLQSNPRILQPKVQASAEVHARRINHKGHNPSPAGKGGVSTHVQEIQLISRLVS
jgi:hypothetical protein